jgi:hypothetical protein
MVALSSCWTLAVGIIRQEAGAQHMSSRTTTVYIGLSLHRWTSGCPVYVSGRTRPYVLSNQSDCCCWIQPRDLTFYTGRRLILSNTFLFRKIRGKLIEKAERPPGGINKMRIKGNSYSIVQQERHVKVSSPDAVLAFV